MRMTQGISTHTHVFIVIGSDYLPEDGNPWAAYRHQPQPGSLPQTVQGHTMLPRGTAATALATLALWPTQSRAALDELEAAVRKEATLIWYVEQMSREVAEAMGKRFTQHYPGIKITVICTTSQVAYERLMQELKNKTPQCDVFSFTDIAYCPALKARGAPARYEPASTGHPHSRFQWIGRGRILRSRDRVIAGDDLPERQGHRGRYPAAVDRSAGSGMERPYRHRPSGVQRLFR